MLASDDVPEDLRDQAQGALRHYPDSDELKQMISEIDRLPHEFLDQRWLARKMRGWVMPPLLCQELARKATQR